MKPMLLVIFKEGDIFYRETRQAVNIQKVQSNFIRRVEKKANLRSEILISVRQKCSR